MVVGAGRRNLQSPLDSTGVDIQLFGYSTNAFALTAQEMNLRQQVGMIQEVTLTGNI